MIRTQILLDEAAYKALRGRAFEAGVSLSSIVRGILGTALRPRPSRGRPTLEDFPFVACGRSKQGDLSPVSERHDEALSATFHSPRPPAKKRLR